MAFITLAMAVVLREKYAPTILEEKVRRLRKKTSNPNLRSKLDRGLSPRKAFRQAFVRPMKLLFLCHIIALLAMFMAVVYGYLYLMFTTITVVFQTQYGFSSGIVGLAFLSVGIGMFIGLAIFGALSDRIIEAKAAASTGELLPEYRLVFLLPGAIVIHIGLFIYGWTAEYKVSWL